MRRPLALLAVVALSAGTARATEPLDLELGRLGAPSAAAWTAAGVTDPAQAARLAGESKVRFARLSADLGLAFGSALLQPGSTTGHSGFAFDLESAYAQVHHGVIGADHAEPGFAFDAPDYWVTREMRPSELFITSVHVRKALPFSIELGGRFMYLSQSSYFAGQVEAKWAMLEGYRELPDVALRGAYTSVLGQRDLRLRTTDFGLLVSKRFGVNAVTSLTPYLAARFTLLSASTDAMAFRADDTTGTPLTPDQVLASSAAFPDFSGLFYRTTAGVRLTSFAVSLAAEVTYYGGGTFETKDPGPDDYPTLWVPSSLAGAFKLGFEF